MYQPSQAQLQLAALAFGFVQLASFEWGNYHTHSIEGGRSAPLT